MDAMLSAKERRHFMLRLRFSSRSTVARLSAPRFHTLLPRTLLRMSRFLELSLHALRFDCDNDPMEVEDEFPKKASRT
jgi:hypothetical protein